MDNTKEICRNITESSLAIELNKILNCYMKIYDEYYETYSRDSAFLKDLVDSIQGISACLEVYITYGKLDPTYAIEKLNYSIDMINSVKKFYETKSKESEKYYE